MPGPVGPKAGFDRLSQNLEKAADELKEQAKAGKAQAKDAAQAAAADAYGATAKLFDGLSSTADAAAHQAASGQYVAKGVQGWVSDEVAEGGRYVAKATARGLSTIAETYGKLMGGGFSPMVRELESDAHALRFSDRMFGRAGRELQKRADAMATAWKGYAEAIATLSGLEGKLPAAGMNVQAVAANLAKAAALAMSSNATKLAELGAKIGAQALHAAEAGSDGARELVMLSARFSGIVANVVANPDQAQVQTVVRDALAAVRAEVLQLVAQHPALAAHAGALATA